MPVLVGRFLIRLFSGPVIRQKGKTGLQRQETGPETGFWAEPESVSSSCPTY